MYTHNIYYIYIERERESERETDREKEREREETAPKLRTGNVAARPPKMLRAFQHNPKWTNHQPAKQKSVLFTNPGPVLNGDSVSEEPILAGSKGLHGH